LKRFKENFYNILKPTKTLGTFVSITESLSDNYGMSSSRLKSTIIDKLKSNKVAGSDNIPPQLIKMEENFEIENIN